MNEIRIHGRGGQGAVGAAEMLALAAIGEGKYAQAFPSFGPERRGAPVVAFCRIDDKPILTREPIREPDVVVVLDPTVMRGTDVAAGLKPGGKIVINTGRPASEIAEQYGFTGISLATVDASSIARNVLGRPITNTAMLGALLRVQDVVKLEALFTQITERFPAIAEKNIKALQCSFDETRVEELAAAKEK